MMSRDHIRKTVKAAAETVFGNAGAARYASGAAPSVETSAPPRELREFAHTLEARFNVSIPRDDLPNVRTLEGCIDYLDLRLNGITR